MTTEPDDYQEITRYAFGLLTARANTPAGEWLSGGYEKYWLEGSKDLEARMGSEFDEYLTLDLLNMANYFLTFASAVSGLGVDALLQSLRQDYVEAETESPDDPA